MEMVVEALPVIPSHSDVTGDLCTQCLSKQQQARPAESIHTPFATLCRTVLSITAVPDIDTHVLFAASPAYNPAKLQAYPTVF
jgi:hypothetical protein